MATSSPSTLVRLMTALVAALMFSGCMSIDIDGVSLCRDENWAESTLYFGRSTEANPISDEAWKTFVETEVTPRFPDGFSYLDGKGAWYNSAFKRTIYENSTLLIILHPDTRENRMKIAEVADAWRVTFNQQAVLRARQDVCVAFITE